MMNIAKIGGCLIAAHFKSHKDEQGKAKPSQFVL